MGLPMKRWLLVVVCVLSARAVSAQIGSPVHTEWRGGSGGSQSPSSVDSATGNKNFYIVHCGSISGTTITITDNADAGAYNSLTKRGSDGTSQIFWKGGATTSATLKWTSSCSSCFPSCQGYAFDGVAASQGTVSENGNVSGTGATSGNTNAVTVATTNDLVIAGLGLGANTNTPTVSESGYTVNGLPYDGSTSYNGFSAWGLKASGSQSVTWNWTTASTGEGMTIATFIAGGGGGGGGTQIENNFFTDARPRAQQPNIMYRQIVPWMPWQWAGVGSLVIATAAILLFLAVKIGVAVEDTYLWWSDRHYHAANARERRTVERLRADNAARDDALRPVGIKRS